MLFQLKYEGGNDLEPLVLLIKFGELIEGFNLNYLPPGGRIDETVDKLTCIFGEKGILQKYKELTEDFSISLLQNEEKMKNVGYELLSEFPELKGTYRKYYRVQCSRILEISVSEFK